STKVQLKRKNSLVIECKAINHGVEKMENIILVVEENNRGNSTKAVTEEKINIDCRTDIEQEKKTEDIMLVDKENDKFDVTRSIVEEEMNIDHQEISTQKKKETLVIIATYIPPNNESEMDKMLNEITDIYNKRNVRTHIVILGDFNCIVDIELDKISESRANFYI
ncbi:1706_t:CDS:2, partial [Gigaspora rosea]